MKKMLFIVGFLLIMNLASAQNYTLTDYNIDTELYPSGLVKEKIFFKLTNLEGDIDYITYSLLTEPENIIVYDETGHLDYGITKNSEYQVITWKRVRAGEAASLRIEFQTKGLVELIERKYIFSFRYTPPTDVKNFKMNLKLPQGFILSSITPSASPTPSNMYTDGKNIILQWNYDDLAEEVSFIVIYERGFFEESDYLLYIFFLCLISGLVATFLIYVKKFRKEKREVVRMTLSEDEKRIMDIITKDKETTQKKVVRETGFSKSKVSKLVRRLEEKGVIKKTPWMRTNKLTLSKRMKK